MENLTALSNLFTIHYGVNLELNKLEICSKHEEGAIPFVSRTDRNNGISAYVRPYKDKNTNPKNTISVAGGGSVLASFVQTEE